MQEGHMNISRKFASIAFAVVLGMTFMWGNSSAANAAPSSQPQFQPYQIKLTENESLFFNSTSSSKTANQIAPQTVTVLNEVFGFKQIQTWQGLRWIEPLNYTELMDTTYKLLVQVPVTDKPSGKEIANIAPQIIHVHEKTYHALNYEMHSYSIDTWLGPKWITPGRYNIEPVVAATPDQTTIHIIQNTPTMNFPDGQYTVTSPQTVMSFERWKNWYHIHTKNGDVWLTPSQFEGFFGDIEPVSMKVTVPASTQLYSQPLLNWPIPNTKLTAQNVSVKGKWGTWYQITTWLGDMWIDGSHLNG
jgi:hypothetical protein